MVQSVETVGGSLSVAAESFSECRVEKDTVGVLGTLGRSEYFLHAVGEAPSFRPRPPTAAAQAQLKAELEAALRQRRKRRREDPEAEPTPAAHATWRRSKAGETVCQRHFLYPKECFSRPIQSVR